MKKSSYIFAGLFVLVLAPGVFAQTPASSARLKLSSESVFFTEPYNYLAPPVPNSVGMCLDLDYIETRYEFGFVNTLELKGPMPEFKKRVPVTNPEQLARIKDKSGFQSGDRVTVISEAGKVYPARITGFSYVGNSPSTIIVAADLGVETREPDPTLFTKRGVAVRGMQDITPEGRITAAAPLDESDPVRQKLFRLCAADVGPGIVVQDVIARSAVLSAGESGFFFVSYWQRPDPDFEIEDVELKSCLFKPMGEGWAKAEMPTPFQLVQVYDLDQDGKAEIFAITGDGAEVCHIFLTPQSDGGYTMVKKGLCAGY